MNLNWQLKIKTSHKVFVFAFVQPVKSCRELDQNIYCLITNNKYKTNKIFHCLNN